MGQSIWQQVKTVSMRLWEDEQPDEPKPSARHETVGYVIKGKAELHD